MRRDLLSARQRDDEKIRNFIRRVTRLSKRLSDVSDRQIVQIVWDGALSYLRLKWADAGFDFETSSLSALETAAKGYEVSETIRRIEAVKRAADAAAVKSAGSQTPSKKPPASGASFGTGTSKSRLTEAEREQFRAENRCFYCREIGHSKHNCPSLHEASAPKVRASAATVLGTATPTSTASVSTTSPKRWLRPNSCKISVSVSVPLFFLSVSFSP
ncbi:hypothetical protein K438DRAFT_1655163 [Mycena galopus ATCC 62051]|nr:hypothetical protein K438DRAFT_1655163 [Mycena galopus ATCC 62051]